MIGLEWMKHEYHLPSLGFLKYYFLQKYIINNSLKIYINSFYLSSIVLFLHYYIIRT